MRQQASQKDTTLSSSKGDERLISPTAEALSSAGPLSLSEPELPEAQEQKIGMSCAASPGNADNHKTGSRQFTLANTDTKRTPSSIECGKKTKPIFREWFCFLTHNSLDLVLHTVQYLLLFNTSSDSS